jgi:hypothetical protein
MFRVENHLAPASISNVWSIFGSGEVILSGVIQSPIVHTTTEIPVFLQEENNTGDCLPYQSTLYHVSEYLSRLCLLGQRQLPWGLLDRSDLASVNVVVHSVGPPIATALGSKDVTKLDNQVLQLSGLFVN